MQFYGFKRRHGPLSPVDLFVEGDYIIWKNVFLVVGTPGLSGKIKVSLDVEDGELQRLSITKSRARIIKNEEDVETTQNMDKEREEDSNEPPTLVHYDFVQAPEERILFPLWVDYIAGVGKVQGRLKLTARNSSGKVIASESLHFRVLHSNFAPGAVKNAKSGKASKETEG